jgi:hypothetical protein
MPDTKQTALLPKGEANGLAAIADELVKNPNQLRAALIVFDAKRGTEDYDLHDTVVTVRIRRVELVLPQDLNAVEQMIRRSLEFRSGQTTLELELEDEIRLTFEQMKEPDSTEDPDEKGGKDGKDGKDGAK